MTSWIDLPDSVAHLRGIPEMIVATLANQDRGDTLTQGRQGDFLSPGNYEENPLLDAFSRGVRREGPSCGPSRGTGSKSRIKTLVWINC